MADCTIKCLSVAILISAGTFASAQNDDMGKSAFQSFCASCHGTDAKGNGSLNEQLRVAASNLTLLAKKMVVCCLLAHCTTLSMDEK